MPPRPRKKARMAKFYPLRARAPIMKYVRTFRLENWTPSTATTADFWRYYQPTFAQLQAYTEFTTLFDEYRISALKLTFRPRYNSFDGANTTDTTLPGVTNQGQTYLSIIVDDSTSTPAPAGVYTVTNYNGFSEIGRVKTYVANRPISVYWKPKVTDTVQGLNCRALRSPWIGIDQTGISHRGVHAFAHDVNFTGVFGQSFDVYLTYYLMFKGFR